MQPKNKNYITQEGLEELRREHIELTTVQRSEIIARLQQTREMGDVENQAYDDAREEQSLLESRITELERLLKNAVIVSHEVHELPDFVVIGSTVVCEMNGEIHEFTIVGSAEADPIRKRISNESPVGKTLLGTRAGEVIHIQVGPVQTQVKVLEIR